MKVICAPFVYLQFGFVIVWQNIIGTKDAHTMLVFAHILRATFQCFVYLLAKERG
jgi:hypothetical protein